MMWLEVQIDASYENRVMVAATYDICYCDENCLNSAYWFKAMSDCLRSFKPSENLDCPWRLAPWTLSPSTAISLLLMPHNLSASHGCRRFSVHIAGAPEDYTTGSYGELPAIVNTGAFLHGPNGTR